MASSNQAALSPEPGSAPDSLGRGFRAGAIALGMLLALAYLLPSWILWLRGGLEGGGHLSMIPFFAVLLLLAVRKLPRPFKLRLSGKEIRVVFGILVLGVAGLQAIGFIIALLPMPYYYATPENDYEGHFLSEVPTYLVPYEDPGDGTLPDAIVRFYRGSTPGQSVPWGAWAGPIAWWMALLILLFGTQVCLGSLLRKQWEDHEKLMFPHVAMVTGLLEPGTPEQPSIGRNRLFWAGVGVSVFLLTLDGLKHYFPTIPAPELNKITMKPFFAEEPWRSMRPELKIEPYLVAISYMLTTEISLSIWFFSILDNLMRAIASAFGLPQTVTTAWVGGFMNGGSDAVGAVIVFVGALFWTGRRHLKAVAELAIGRGAPTESSQEAMSYPVSVWGFWICAIGVLIWCMIAGMSIWFSILVFLLYTISAIFVARLVSETGMIAARTAFRSVPVSIEWVGFGGGDLTERALGQAVAKPPLLRTMSVVSFIFPSVLSSHGVLTNLLTGLRAVGDDSARSDDGLARRRVLQLGFLGLVVAMLVFAARMLEETYGRGALHSSLYWLHSGTWVFENTLVRDIILRESAQTTEWTKVSFVVMGAGVMGVLLYLRRAFYWWPLHPIGYIASGVHRGLWFSVFIGWLIKRTILKYGGGEGFKRSIAFFIGLFAGQYAMTILWYFIGLSGGETTPPFRGL